MSRGRRAFSSGRCAVLGEMARASLLGSETRELVQVAAGGPRPVKDQATLRHCDPLGPFERRADEQWAVIRPQPEEGSQGP